LLGIDWYINQLRYKVNESDPIDVIWSAEQIQGRNRDYVVYNPRTDINQNNYYDLYDVMKNVVGSDDANMKVAMQNGESLNYLPTKKFKIPVDRKVVETNQVINPSDSTTDVLIQIGVEQELYHEE
jgi:hypothetical protein